MCGDGLGGMCAGTVWVGMVVKSVVEDIVKNIHLVYFTSGVM